MLIRYPRMFRPGSRPNDFFLSIDIARDGYLLYSGKHYW
jgi:hypothetical protein